ncbi:MAG: ABC-2 family transporter protein [Spirochaetaceae bacterium]|nr:ABC-2 family transporter protein [Spirochaetaceae bacterium]
MQMTFCYFRNDLKLRFSSRARILSDTIRFFSAIIFPFVIWYSFMHEDASAYLYLRRIVLNYLFFSLFSHTHYEYIAQVIVNGRLNIKLLKPYSLRHTFFSYYAGNFLARFLFLGLPIIVFIYFFYTIDISVLHTQLLSVGLFLFFLLFIFALGFFFGMTIAGFAFWVGDIWAVRLFLAAGSGAVAGTWFPFEGTLHFMSFSPFGVVADGVTRFLETSFFEQQLYCGMACVWVLVFFLASVVLWGNGLKKYEAEGG